MSQPAILRDRRVAGYRVLRSLSRGPESVVLLGYRDVAGDSAGDGARDNADQPEVDAVASVTNQEHDRLVAISIGPARPENWCRVAAELAALDRAHGPHVVRVLDVDVDVDVEVAREDRESVCVVYERLNRGDLAELLAVRHVLGAGEAVTLLAPLAQTVLRMHAAGVAHGRISTSTIRFRDDGAPVLIGFGAASLFAPGAPEVVLEREPGVIADRRALRALAVPVLARVQGPRARAAAQLAASLEAIADEFLLGLLATDLFDLASPTPISFDPDPVEPPEPAARLVPLGPPVADLPDPMLAPMSLRHRAVARARTAVVEHIAARAVVGDLVLLLAPTVARLRRWFTAFTPRGRRLVVGAAAASAAVLLAVTLIPGESSSGGSASPREDASATSSSVLVAGEGTVTASPSDADDPIAAASGVLRARERCITSLSVLCLDQVDAADSAALRGDRESVRAAQQGAELTDPLPSSDTVMPELIERFGGSALIRLVPRPPATTSTVTEPASLLLVQAEGGWRIRDVIGPDR